MEKRKTTMEQRTCGNLICSWPHLTSHRYKRKGQLMTKALSKQNKIQSHVHLESHRPLSWFLPLSSSQMTDRSDAVKGITFRVRASKKLIPWIGINPGLDHKQDGTIKPWRGWASTSVRDAWAASDGLVRCTLHIHSPLCRAQRVQQRDRRLRVSLSRYTPWQ